MLAEPVDPPPPSSAPTSPERIAEVAHAVERQLAHKRSVVVGLKVLRREVRQEGPTPTDAEVEAARPRIRADCVNGARPCPWVGCKYHLWLDVTSSGGLQFNQGGRALEECAETCALDVADRGGSTLEQVGSVMAITRERVRQLESKALRRLVQRCEELEGRLAGGRPIGLGGIRPEGAHCLSCGALYPADGKRRCPGCRR